MSSDNDKRNMLSREDQQLSSYPGVIRNDFMIQFGEKANEDGLPCTACDEVGEVLCFTRGRKGPFCLECFESLCDPDQSLLLEERLAQYEDQAEKAKP